MWKKCISGICISILVLLAVAMVAGYAGTADAATPPVQTGVTTDPIQPESCATCHKDAGGKHQASYNELYQDGVIQVTDLAYSFAPTGTHTVTFTMTKDGDPFDARKADSLAIYFAPYTDGKFQFEPAAERLSLLGDLTYDGEGGVTSTLVGDIPDVSDTPGLIVVYGRDETIGTIPGTRVTQNRYPFAALLETGSGVDYVSAANVAGCEKCHTVPYLKHSYIYGQVNGDPGTDFYTCKACHLDNGVGEHFEWQLLVDDPAAAVDFIVHETPLTPEQEEKYAYRPTVMNDVHMSHAMEFPYSQSMANCVTCHEGKLDTILTDASFTGETCKSCHPVTGSEEHGTAELALETLMPSPIHDDMDLETTDCASCHSEEGGASVFSEIHPGYDRVIYTAEGLRYSDVISVTIDSVDFDGSELNIQFSAAESTDLEGLDVADIVPTVLVGLYGYDTKDYIIGPHERLFDDNGDGEINGDDQRTLEYVVGEEHPRLTTVSADGGSWEVVADLSAWTDMIADGTVKRAEVAVMPALTDANGVMLAINSPSRTFDLAANAFVDDFYSPIVKVTDGCNNCHDALATTFHTPDHGSGNVVVCRMCHITKSGGSHLEVQSRSIDSYIHAIHAFQGFDIGDINFADPVQALHYEEHVTFPFPTHANTNCESCHVEGMYNVPDQSKSLPGLLSATDVLSGTERSLPDMPSYVTGPASRACGGCHRAVLINEDKAGELVSFMQHTKQGGYLIEAGEDPSSTLSAVIDEIEALFK
jgi:OmcA/MtrC family decaheme c-type cytochrome